MVLLPPFLDGSRPLAPQLSMLIAVILTIEFASMLVYATGGKTLRKLLGKSGNVRLLNRIAGTLMIGVGMWLALGSTSHSLHESLCLNGREKSNT
jgi:threonine/homoserine/homoserine lactone efflux protein